MIPLHQTRTTPPPPPVDGPASTANKAEGLDGEPPDLGRVPLIALDIVLDVEDWSAFVDPVFGDVEAIVIAAANAVAARLEFQALAEVTIALSSDAEVAKLNGTFRGKPMPTNVLSFPAGAQRHASPFGAPKQLGDIIIARETVLAEAVTLSISPSHHLVHLVVHGLLHLLGYDHETDDEAGAMEALEITILATLNVSDPYSGSDPVFDGAQLSNGET